MKKTLLIAAAFFLLFRTSDGKLVGFVELATPPLMRPSVTALEIHNGTGTVRALALRIAEIGPENIRLKDGKVVRRRQRSIVQTVIEDVEIKRFKVRGRP